MFGIVAENNNWSRIAGDLPPLAKDIVVELMSYMDKRSGNCL